MRLPATALLLFMTSGFAWSEGLPAVPETFSALEGSAQFRLGGAAARAPLPSVDLPSETPSVLPRLRLSVPRLIRETKQTVRHTPFGGLRIYFGEAWNQGEDVLQLGTALTRGQTTAGLSVTYEDGDYDVTSSELYLDYALSEQLSVGISGILNEEVTLEDSPVPQLGMNAELSISGNSYLRGGIADSSRSDPVFGLAVGLRF